MDRKPKAEVGLVLYPGCQAAMVHGMTDLFAIADQISARQDGPTVRISHWSLGADGRFDRVADSDRGWRDAGPDILVAPGRLQGPLSADEATPYARWLVDRHAAGAVLAANCGGVFMLGATGLLAGRPATTHWCFADDFRARFPDVLLDVDRIVIDDGDIVTAGGLMAWTDLGLRLVDRLYGPTVMVETGQFFLIDPAGREQKHYASFSPRLTHGDAAILKAQHWLQSRRPGAVSVAEMCAVAGLEERTFLRRFKSATGMRPVEYVQHLRVGKARGLLEFTRRTVDQIAWSVGYEDPAAFRKLFHRVVGLSPSQYRARFGVERAAEEAA